MKTFTTYCCQLLKKGAFLTLFCLSTYSLVAANLTAKQSGNWSNTSTWSGGALPRSNDDVTIKSGITVTLNIANAVCSSLILNDNVAGTASLLFNSGSSLEVSGTLTLSGSNAGYNGTLSMANGGTLECGTIAIGNGTATFTSGTGTVQIDNNITINAGTLTTFNNLIIHGGTTTLNADLTINGNLTIGTSSVGSLSPQNHTVSIKGNWNHVNPNNGFNESTSTVSFIGNGNQSVSCTGSFYNFVVNKTAGIVTFNIPNSTNDELSTYNDLTILAGTLTLGSSANTISVGGNLSVAGILDLSNATATSLSVDGNITNSGTIDVSGSSLTNPGNRTTSGGSFTMTGTALLKIGKTNSFPTNYATISLSPTSTVNYAGTTQTVKGALTYGDLIISGSGTKTLATNTNVAGDITVSAGTFNVSTNATRITLNGNTTQVMSGVSFYNLTVNNTAITDAVSLSSETTVSNNLVFTDGIINASTNALKLLAATTFSGVSNSSHVKGTVKKVTSSTSSFIFPIGNGIIYRPVGIVSPSNDTWLASYSSSPYSNTNSFSNNDVLVIKHVSTLEYWNLSPASNGSSAKIMLSWGDGSVVKNPSTTVISHWNSTNSYWENVGNVTVDAVSKTLTSVNSWNSFSPFTFGSTANDGSLPIDLIDFNATLRH